MKRNTIIASVVCSLGVAAILPLTIIGSEGMAPKQQAKAPKAEKALEPKTESAAQKRATKVASGLSDEKLRNWNPSKGFHQRRLST